MSKEPTPLGGATPSRRSCTTEPKLKQFGFLSVHVHEDAPTPELP